MRFISPRTVLNNSNHNLGPLDLQKCALGL